MNTNPNIITTSPETPVAAPANPPPHVGGYEPVTTQQPETPEWAAKRHDPNTRPENLVDRIVDEAFPEAPKDIKSEAGKANWKLLRAKAKERNEMESKWRQAQQELENYKKNPREVMSEMESLRKERDTLSDRLKELDVERHPKFKAYFEEKVNTVHNQVKQIGGKEYGDKLVNILKLPASDWRTAQLEEIFKRLTPIHQTQLGAVLVDAEKIDAERASEISKAKENYQKFQLQQQEAQRKTVEQQRTLVERTFNHVINEATDALEGFHVFQRREGDEAWNRQVDELIGAARRIYNRQLDLPELARAATWAAAAPVILQDALAKAQEIAALQKELVALKAARPKPGAGTDPKGPDVPTHLSLSDRIVWQAQQAGAVR